MTPAATKTPLPTATFTPTATPSPTATLAPTSTPVPTVTPTPETGRTVELAELQSKAAEDGNLCATAYLAYTEGGYAEFMTFAKENWILEQIPFLAEVPEKNTVMASGDEWYLLVPVDETVRFTVSECVLDETTFTLVAGKQLLQLEAGECLLLRGNVSDIYPSFMVTIMGADGTVIQYAPGLSLKDGSLNVIDGVYDFTR